MSLTNFIKKIDVNQESMMVYNLKSNIDEVFTTVVALLLTIVSIFRQAVFPIAVMIGCGSYFLLRNIYRYEDCPDRKLLYLFFLFINYIILTMIVPNHSIVLFIIPIVSLLPSNALKILWFRYSYYFLPILLSLLNYLVWYPTYYKKAGKLNPATYLTFFGSLILIELSLLIYAKLRTAYYYILYKDANMKDALNHTAIAKLSEHNLNQRLALQNAVIDRNARLEEREAIGRTIHNVVGHTITSALITLEAAELLANQDSELSKEKIMIAKERLGQSLTTIRRAVRLVDNANTSIPLTDLFYTMTSTIQEFTQDTSLRVRHNIQITNEKDTSLNKYAQFSIETKHAEFLHGAILECLTNGQKHGNATAFLILATIEYSILTISVSDNGSSMKQLTPVEQERCLLQGYGLKKIKTYLENIGGEFSLNYMDDFWVVMKLPLLTEKSMQK
ncbi:sensor histidine kinase [Lachnoclostridium phytofermentans]|uniref:histidine kinase n=1 Tax=Lachnoclostridium phytofermentans (strain ATCC 700394 / DSM 18823 / ISDg) TaxID=357809 RepID=A9KJF6_LACP7|nr:histidine kinase [Lachnoclostridium phytofermentans]ABX43976.1 Signal transduction histidine kinase-like protein [Lachnoclostridium phytofermentans ISDg]